MSFWQNDPIADAPASGGPSNVQPIIAVPNYRGAGDARDEVRTDIAVRDESRKVSDTAFTRKDKLRADYEALAPVKEYRSSLQSLASALQTAPNATGDNALIYAYAKIMDPASVVRESEMAMAGSGDSTVNAVGARLAKEFGIDGGGQLSPQVRERLRREAIGAVSQRVKLYNQQRDRFSELAQRDGFDPYEVVGDHDGKPYLDQFRAYGQPAKADARDPEMVGGLPVGTDITFAGDDGTGFDRNKWLMATQGVTPNQEAQISGFWNANVGNPNLGGEGVRAFYEKIGAPLVFEPGALEDRIAKARAGNVRFAGFDSSGPEQDYQARVDALAKERDNFGGAADAFVRGAAQVPSFGLVDKVSAVSDTIFDGGTYDENMDKQRLLNTADAQANPWAQLGGEVTGAVLTPYGAGARTPMQLAKVGGVTSGATEFNQSSADFVDRLGPTALATATGAGLGYGTGKSAEVFLPAIGRMTSRAPQIADDLPPDLSAPEFIAAAQRRNVDYLPGDIPGARGTQIATALTDNTLGSTFIQKGAEKAVASVDNAVARTTDNLGGAVDDAGAGQAVQRGVNSRQDATDTKIDELYEAIPIKPESTADTTNTLAALREINNPVGSNPALSAEISDSTLKRYQQALESGGLSWQDLKKFRSYIGSKAGKATFQRDIPKERLDALYAGMSRDMESTALKEGPQALSAFKRANTYKRAVEGRRENVMRQLLGKDLNLNPEKAFAQIQSWSKAKGGDFAKLSQAVRSLPEPEANAVRATIIDMLGKATDGAQNSVGSVFSPAAFATQWNKLSPRAKAVLFQKEHRAALDDIAGISSAMKASQKYNNTSRTGLTVGAGGTLVAGSAGVLPALAAVGGQLLSGAILGSPRVAKWAAALYRKPNQPAAMAHIARLDNIAKAEPVIANEVLQLQTRLREAFAGTPDRLAATTPDQKSESLPPASTTTAGEYQ